MRLRTISARLLLGLAIVAGVLWLALHRDQLDPVLIENAIRGLGPWGPAAMSYYSRWEPFCSFQARSSASPAACSLGRSGELFSIWPAQRWGLPRRFW